MRSAGELLHQLLEPVDAPGAEREPRAGVREQPRGREADAARRARDDRRAAVQGVHGEQTSAWRAPARRKRRWPRPRGRPGRAPRRPRRQADEVAEERRVRPLAALVRGDPRELEDLVALLTGQLVLGRLVAGSGREPFPRLLQPFVHDASLVRRRPVRGQTLDVSRTDMSGVRPRPGPFRPVGRAERHRLRRGCPHVSRRTGGRPQDMSLRDRSPGCLDSRRP